MTVSVVGTPTFSSTQASTTLTITLPAKQSGDYIVLLVGCGEDSPQPAVVTPPSGFTAIGTIGFFDYGPGGITQHIYYKLSNGAEANPSITWNTGNSNGGGLWALAAVVRSTVGWHTTTPVTIVSQGIDTSGSTSNPAPPDFSIAAAGYGLHFLQSSDDNTSTISTANGWTLRGGGATTDGTDGSIHVADQSFATSGTKSHPVWSLPLGPDYYGYRTLLFRENVGENGNASGGLPTITSAAPAGAGAGAGTVSAALPSLTISAPTGSAGVDVNVSADLATVTLVAADGSVAGTANVTAGLSTLTVAAPDATTSAGASVTAGLGTITVATPAGSAEGTGGSFEWDETLYPDAILQQIGLSGVVGNVDESVDSPDGLWLVR